MPILATKLYIPSPRSKLISRPRLMGRLNEGLSLGRKLTLISAPAGFGKTTLISEWVAECKTQREPERPGTFEYPDQPAACGGDKHRERP